MVRCGSRASSEPAEHYATPLLTPSTLQAKRSFGTPKAEEDVPEEEPKPKSDLDVLSDYFGNSFIIYDEIYDSVQASDAWVEIQQREYLSLHTKTLF